MFNWKSGFIVTITVLSILFLVQTFVILNLYSNDINKFAKTGFIYDEETFVVLESLVKKFSEKNMELTKTEIIDILNKDINIFPIIEIPGGTNRYTVGNVYFEFDENDVLIKIRPNPIRQLYKKELEIDDQREIYGISRISHFAIMHKNLSEGFFQGGNHMWLGVILSIIFVVALFYYVRFEMKTKNYNHLKISLIISTILVLLIFVSLFYHLYWVKLTIEEVSRNIGFIGIHYIFQGFDLIFIFPTLLIDIMLVSYILIIFILKRFFSFNKNLVKISA